MEKEKQTSPAAPKGKAKEKKKRKVSKTWEAAQKLKGTLIVNDPALLLQAMRYLIDTNIFVQSPGIGKSAINLAQRDERCALTATNSKTDRRSWQGLLCKIPTSPL